MASREKHGLPKMSGSEFPILAAPKNNTVGKASSPAEHLTSDHLKSGTSGSTQGDPIGRRGFGGNEIRLVGSLVGDRALAPISSILDSKESSRASDSIGGRIKGGKGGLRSGTPFRSADFQTDLKPVTDVSETGVPDSVEGAEKGVHGCQMTVSPVGDRAPAPETAKLDGVMQGMSAVYPVVHPSPDPFDGEGYGGKEGR